MNLTGFEYKPFSTPLTKTFKNASFGISVRAGFIISISGEMGRVALGEVAPLPGFSSETLADAEKELKSASELAPGFIEAKDSATLKWFFSDIQFTPSVRFGIEQAMISMLLKRDRSLFLESFYKSSRIIPVNAVVSLNSDVITGIEEKLNFGYSTFKIKLGRKNFSEDLALIKEVRSRFGNEINIRLDVNGAWSLEDAVQNIDALKSLNIEYIEEPCSGLENLIRLAGISPVPVAADESVKNINDAERVITESPIKFIVIKPVVLGGFFGTTELISIAETAGKNIIISSAFETPLGKSLLVFLASLTGHSYAHGLDTAGFLSDELFIDPYPVVNGTIRFSPDSYPPEFQKGKL